jgi:hypothetical protein
MPLLPQRRMLTERQLKYACGCNENRALKNNQPLPDKHQNISLK